MPDERNLQSQPRVPLKQLLEEHSRIVARMPEWMKGWRVERSADAPFEPLRARVPLQQLLDEHSKIVAEMPEWMKGSRQDREK